MSERYTVVSFTDPQLRAMLGAMNARREELDTSGARLTREEAAELRALANATSTVVKALGRFA